MELFQAVLQTENEMKALQFRNGIAMRNLLTPEQAAKLLPIASKEKAAGGSPNAGDLKERLQQLRAEISKRSGSGGDVPPEVVAQVEQIDQALKQGRVAEARGQIDETLRLLRGGVGSATPENKPPAKLKTVASSDDSQGVKGKIEPTAKEKPVKKNESPRPIDGEEVKKKMQVLSEAAQRAESPEQRERLEGMLRNLREAAAAGNQGGVEKILKAVEPALHNPGGEKKGKE